MIGFIKINKAKRKPIRTQTKTYQNPLRTQTKTYQNPLITQTKPNRNPIITMDTQHVSNGTLNHALISEVIFTNDEAFYEVEIEKAKMMLCVCKNAKQNKNIKKSFDNVKIQRHCKYFTLISSKKTDYMLLHYWTKNSIPDLRLGTNQLYKERIVKRVAYLLKGDVDVLEGVKKEMMAEQGRNIDKYRVILEEMIVKYKDGYVIDEELDDDDFTLEEYKIMELITIFKYNAFILNMLYNHEKEKEIIEYISSKNFHNTWWHSRHATIKFS